MDLRATESNLTERETGSDSEVVIDPVGDVAEEAGFSSAASSSTQAPPPPAAAAAEESDSQVQQQEEHPGFSSPTRPHDGSPPHSLIPRRGRRRREGVGSGTRRPVDRRVLDYLSNAAHDGEEAFGRSLARYLRGIPREHRLRTRGVLQIVLDAGTPPNDPNTVFDFLERWQLSSENQLQLGRQRREGASASQPPPHHHHPPPPPPPLCVQQISTPPPQAPSYSNLPQQLQHMGQCGHSQYAHFNIPNVVGWPQHGYGRHGHIGGHTQTGQTYTYDYQHQFPMYTYPNPHQDPGRNPQVTVQSATTQGDTLVADPARQPTQPGPPSSPPATTCS